MGRLTRRAWLVGAASVGVASAATVVLGGCGASTTVRDPTPSAVRKPAKIGYLSPNADLSPSSIWAALAQVGWIRGSNLDVVFRFAYADTAPEMAREVIDEGVQLIMTEGEPQARAAREATDRIPIVMLSIEDALASGLVSSLARPGGNVTGVSLLGPQLAAKRVQLLHELAPALTGMAIMWHPGILDTAREFEHAQAATRTLGLGLLSLVVGGSAPSVQLGLRHGPSDGLIVTSAASYALAGGSIVRWAEREQVPAVYPNPAYVMRGGLMSYSAQYPPLVDRAAVQIDKILRGADPAEIPVEQPTTFNCTLNTRTVSALGLTIPPALAETVTQWIA